jgi:hypothetical protein
MTVKSTKHYHVLSGLHGYMPDRNDSYHTCANARAGACAIAEDLRAEGFVVNGTKRHGYYEVYGHDSDGCIPGVEYIEVTTCHEPDCLEDIED